MPAVNEQASTDDQAHLQAAQVISEAIEEAVIRSGDTRLRALSDADIRTLAEALVCNPTPLHEAADIITTLDHPPAVPWHQRPLRQIAGLRKA